MVTAVWILSLLRALEPQSPWADSFERMAQAIASETIDHPLPSMTANETAATLTSLAWHESRFNPHAEGCRVKDSNTFGMCLEGRRPISFGAFQVDGTNLRPYYGTGDAHAFEEDIEGQAHVAMVMLRQSFTICRAQPKSDRIAWYAGGGNGCPTANKDALRKSRWRVAKGAWLLRMFPAPE